MKKKARRRKSKNADTILKIFESFRTRAEAALERDPKEKSGALAKAREVALCGHILHSLRSRYDWLAGYSLPTGLPKLRDGLPFQIPTPTEAFEKHQSQRLAWSSLMRKRRDELVASFRASPRSRRGRGGSAGSRSYRSAKHSP